MIQEVVS